MTKKTFKIPAIYLFLGTLTLYVIAAVVGSYIFPTVDNFKYNWNLVVGDFTTEAPEGTRLLMYDTGKIYEKVGDCWYPLEINKEGDCN